MWGGKGRMRAFTFSALGKKGEILMARGRGKGRELEDHIPQLTSRPDS